MTLVEAAALGIGSGLVLRFIVEGVAGVWWAFADVVRGL